MLKSIMLLFVFLLCAGIGAVYVLDLAARRRQITQMLELIRYLRREIRCAARPIAQLLQECSLDLPLLRTMERKDPFDILTAYREAKISCKGEMLFGDEEWSAVDELFFSLGQGDSAEQEIRLNLCEQSFLIAEKKAREALGKNGKPAIVLGCSAGAVLVLMLL